MKFLSLCFLALLLACPKPPNDEKYLMEVTPALALAGSSGTTTGTETGTGTGTATGGETLAVSGKLFRLSNRALILETTLEFQIGEETQSLTSDASGKIQDSLSAGTYTASFAYEGTAYNGTFQLNADGSYCAAIDEILFIGDNPSSGCMACTAGSQTGSLDLTANQWHLANTASPTEDINIEGAWNQGYKGAGQSIVIIDDGLEFNHPDLCENVDLSLNYHFYEQDRDPYLGASRHGTSIAGVIAAADNGFGVRGVAPASRIGSYNVYDAGLFPDSYLASALTRNVENISVFSNSYGHTMGDFKGQYEQALSDQALFQEKIQTGLDTGRGGLGSIYIFAAGNGGED